VELRGVTFGYGPGRVVLEDVDFAVRPGEFVAIAGPNGGGKTTLLRLILGLARPISGTASLFGEPAHRCRRRAEIGYLAQRTQLCGGAPAMVRGVVAAGRLARVRPPGALLLAVGKIVYRLLRRDGLTEQARTSRRPPFGVM